MSLQTGHRYTVVVPDNALISQAGFYLPGEPYGSWEFTTSGTQPPTALLFPPDDSVNVLATRTNLTLLFSEFVEFPLASPGPIVVTDLSSNIVRSYASNDPNVVLSNSSLLIQLPSLGIGRAVEVQVPIGYVQTFAELPFAGLTSSQWNFTTEGLTNPVAVLTVPALSETGVAASTTEVYIRFDQHIRIQSCDIQIKSRSDLETVTVNSLDGAAVVHTGDAVNITIPASLPLREGKVYSVTVPRNCFTSYAYLEFLQFDVQHTWNFTTGSACRLQPLPEAPHSWRRPAHGCAHSPEWHARAFSQHYAAVPQLQ